MEQEFEAQAYDAVCNIFGEAVWQLVVDGEMVMPDTMTSMIMQLSGRRDDLAVSIALAVMHPA